MLCIDDIKIENARECITDQTNPKISFSLSSDQQEVRLAHSEISINGWTYQGKEQLHIPYEGQPLEPFTDYGVHIVAEDNHGQRAEQETHFQTGRMQLPWEGKWITEDTYQFEDTQSPIPFLFRRKFHVKKPVTKAFITSTALGIYELAVNNQKAGNEFFAPGFTSYAHHLQYNTYPVTLQSGENEITAVVGGGWAVGRSTYIQDTNKNISKLSAKRPALLLELHIQYEDGIQEVIASDEAWQVTTQGPYRFGDFYDGETYDATVDLKNITWEQASLFTPEITPQIVARYGASVIAHETMKASFLHTTSTGELIYDFGQNFAGVMTMRLRGHQGQKVVIRHGEVLQTGKLAEKEETPEPGTLYTDSLRSAKQTLTYICQEGEQSYISRLTYMGFRFIEISGIAKEDILELSALALYSDIEENGSFACSNQDLNQLQSNIVWSGKSNFVDIPTDCPQRDERQGWTGDIALFAKTASFNFDMSRFFDKWLIDLMDEQKKSGALPFVIPMRGDTKTTPVMTTSCWGDCCINVPMAEYLSNGDVSLLKRQYDSMSRYMKDAARWAGRLSVGRKNRHIWKLPFHFGDWCAPYGNVKDWLSKGAWTGTAYWSYGCLQMSQICKLLGKEKESQNYLKLRKMICQAYMEEFTDGQGKLKEEFQTGYVLPLYFDMNDETALDAMAEHLWHLIKENGVHLNTGFTSTPYILFALADHGKLKEAYELLLQDTSPSWLYQIRKGGTTLWEQWDSVTEDDRLKSASMNHYAYGAVGDFLYRRVCGLEPVSGGYENFTICPKVGGGLQWASCSHKSPYGMISVKWEMVEDEFVLHFTVPVSTSCQVILPSGKKQTYASGTYTLREPWSGIK